VEQDVAWSEVRNLADVASCIVRAAQARTETRGAHTREDFPETDPALRARFLHGA
jgi:succinate dehydrogenase/fumarate reductase flavoprotein subunit